MVAAGIGLWVLLTSDDGDDAPEEVATEQSSTTVADGADGAEGEATGEATPSAEATPAPDPSLHAIYR